MTKSVSFIRGFYVLFSLIVGICCLSGNALGTEVERCRFTLAVEGKPNPGLSSDIIALRYDDSLEIIEITVNDWGITNNGVGYKYRNGGLPELGSRISLLAGCSEDLIMSEGNIVSISPLNVADGPPTLTFVVSGKKQQASNNSVSVSYGEELSEFQAILELNNIEGTGVTEGIPTLRTGTVLNISNVGLRFDGTYTVTGTVHSFNESKGYITHFSVQRRILHRFK